MWLQFTKISQTLHGSILPFVTLPVTSLSLVDIPSGPLVYNGYAWISQETSIPVSYHSSVDYVIITTVDRSRHNGYAWFPQRTSIHRRPSTALWISLHGHVLPRNYDNLSFMSVQPTSTSKLSSKFKGEGRYFPYFALKTYNTSFLTPHKSYLCQLA